MEGLMGRCGALDYLLQAFGIQAIDELVSLLFADVEDTDISPRRSA
jgi:hypothetical protein